MRCAYQTSLMVDGYQKYPLRKLLETNGQANHVAQERRKVGFNFAFDDLINSDSDYVKEIMREKVFYGLLLKSQCL